LFGISQSYAGVLTSTRIVSAYIWGIIVIILTPLPPENPLN